MTCGCRADDGAAGFSWLLPTPCPAPVDHRPVAPAADALSGTPPAALPQPSTGPSGAAFPSARTLARLRTSLGAYLRGSQSAAEEAAVRHALDDLAHEARERRLHGEQMLLAFKGAWQELPELESAPGHREQQRLLGRLVTLCIDVYYERG